MARMLGNTYAYSTYRRGRRRKKLKPHTPNVLNNEQWFIERWRPLDVAHPSDKVKWPYGRFTADYISFEGRYVIEVRTRPSALSKMTLNKKLYYESKGYLFLFVYSTEEDSVFIARAKIKDRADKPLDAATS